MRIALAGNDVCRELKSALETNPEYEVLIAKNPDEAAKAADEGFVTVLIESGELPRFLTDTVYADSLLEKAPPTAPVVFVLDSGGASPEYAARFVLAKACSLAMAHRNVIVLFKQAKTAFSGTEELYERSRKNGVTFVKYKDIAHIEKSGGIRFAAEGENEETSVVSPLIIDCSISPDEKIKAFAQALGLKELKARHFLYPVLTSRRGVFYISAPVLYGRNMTSVVECIAVELTGAAPKSTARVNAEKCAYCCTCFRVCPHSAPRMSQTGSAMDINADMCQGCGICSALCPASAITLEGGDKAEPTDAKITVFACENSGYDAAKTAAMGRSDVQVYPLKCGGELSPLEVLKALKHCERVVIAVCVEGACRHFDGGRYAQKRAEALIQTLSDMGADVSRVRFTRLAHTQAEAIKELL